MSTRRKMSRNEWKRTERGASSKARKSYRFSNSRYAVELFLATCLGATAGYAALHVDEAPTGTDPCCQATELGAEGDPPSEDRARGARAASPAKDAAPVAVAAGDSACCCAGGSDDEDDDLEDQRDAPLPIRS